MAKIGILTGGGDCPGLNAVIRGIVVRANLLGHTVIGVRRGWRGLLDEGRVTDLSMEDVDDLHMAGGTILGSSMFNPLNEEDGEAQILRNIERHGIDALIVIGGEAALAVADQLTHKGVQIVGVPKTMDNSVAMTDYTFGFATAANIACEAIERLETSAQARERVVFIEVIGQVTGWSALYSGLGAGAHAVLIPEFPFSLDELCETISARKAENKHSIVTVAEGAVPQDKALLAKLEKARDETSQFMGGSGVAVWLAQEVRQRLEVETQSVILGHVQRGGTPTTLDRIFGLRLGARAVEYISAGKTACMTAVKGTEIHEVSLSDAVKTSNRVSREYFDEMKIFFS